MTYQLAEGINLHVLQTNQYKTVRIFVRFTTRLEKEVITKRSLLSSLFLTNCLNYPDQTQLSAKLADLYGASFGLSVRKKGNLHWLNVGISFVNGKYINDLSILNQAVEFLKEVLFFPNIKEQKFDQLTFDLEKNNLRLYLESLNEDKQTMASLALQELYFGQSAAQKTPSFGSIEDLRELTAETLAAYYEKMIAEDQVDIFVVGDISPEEIQRVLSQLPFTHRESLHPEIFYAQTQENMIRKDK